MNNSRSLGAMSAMKDPTTIKLFGKTIPCSQRIVSASAAAAADRDDQHEDCCKEMEVECSLADDLKDPEDKNTMNEDTDSSTFETPNETSIISEAKALIPDKILPCPRCNSLETKFCYFNNYNIKQPRHFCKNCQRYWTAGGSMRNLPVGSGRRKNKHNSTSLYRHIITSGTLQSARGYTSAALKFRSDVPLSDSAASYLSLLRNTQNSSVTAASSSLQKLGNHASLQDQRIIAAGKSFHQGHAGQVLPGPHWGPWNSGIPPPHFGPLGHPPISFYPQPTFWNSWNHQQQPLMSPTSTTSNNSSLLSSHLGKHSREDGDKLSLLSMSSQEQSLKEKCVLVPKTLRIGDPNEAANSSIRATLRMQNEKTSSIGEAGVFHNFQSKSNNPHRIGHKFPAMQANPAALSRSRIFQEGT